MSERVCQGCGVVLPLTSRRGRPRKWCDGCRRPKGGGPQGRARELARDLPGQKFGRLTVLAYRNANSVEVRCECGTEKVVRMDGLRRGDTVSCGCKRREHKPSEAARKAQQTRGRRSATHRAEYACWNNIKYRIFKTDHPAYPNYGGRGLTMEPEWVDDFEAFFAHVGPRPSPEMSIDRINNDLGYVKGNLRWATPVQQTANRRQPKRGVKFDPARFNQARSLR